MSKMIPLPTLKIGTKATVIQLKTQDEGMVRHLMAMGVIPGTPIILERRFPSYVIQVGRTRAALDAETAQTIYVEI